MRKSLVPYVKIKFDSGISRGALIDTSVICNRLFQEIIETDKSAANILNNITQLQIQPQGPEKY